jgi:predicted SnoaL-like aldol condensation-catalyzing enzyme
MKKFISILCSTGFIFLVSCNSKEAGMSDTAKKNLDAFMTVSNSFQTGDTSQIDDVVAADFVDHTDKGDRGRDSLIAMIAEMKAANMQMKSEVIKSFADDEYVFGWMRWTGTGNGQMGMPMGPYEMSGIEVVKFKDNKAVEHWSFMEPREMMKMMPSTHADTSKSKTVGKDTTSKM